MCEHCPPIEAACDNTPMSLERALNNRKFLIRCYTPVPIHRSSNTKIFQIWHRAVSTAGPDLEWPFSGVGGNDRERRHGRERYR